MLIRGQTTEDRIRQIAQGFSQGLQGYADYANQTAKGLREEKALNLQNEAKKRQEAIQAIELSNNIEKQTGKYIDPGQVQSLISNPTNFGEVLKTAPMSRRAELEAQKLERENIRQQREDEKYQREKLESEKPIEETRDFQKAMKLQQQKLANQKEKITPDQRKVATFSTRIEQAEDVFRNLETGGFNRAGAGTALQGFLPEAMKPEALKQQEQAERNFVNAVLRRESGAAIADSEFESAQKQYFPRVGDSPQVIAQKRANREAVLAGLRAEAGDVAINQIRERIPVTNPIQSPMARPRITDQNQDAKLQRLMELRAKKAGA